MNQRSVTRVRVSPQIYGEDDQVLLAALEAVDRIDLDQSGALGAEELQGMTDESLILRLGDLDLGDGAQNERLQRFVARFRRRALPKRVLALPYYQNREVQDELVERYFAPGRQEQRFAWEQRMEEQARAVLGQDVDILLYCPKRRMQLKEARIHVRWPAFHEAFNYKMAD